MFRRWIAAALISTLVTIAAAPAGWADSVADKKREAQRIAAKLDQLEAKAEQLSEQYNDARYQLAALDADVADAQQALGEKQSRISEVQQRLSGWALRAYVNASAADPVFDVLGSAASSDSVGIDGYAQVAVGKDSNLTDELRQTRQDATATEARLSNALALQSSLKADLEVKKKAADAAVGSTQKLLAQTNSELVVLVEAERRRREAEEEARVKAEIEARKAARQAELARQRAQESAARTGGAASPAPAPVRVVNPPPPPSPGAAGAVEQAMSQIGVTYRWGQDDPESGFDCSGLTSWAWGRVGVSIPHSSRAQFNSLARVEPEDLEPGDLVFFGSPVHHVGMYFGNGQMVHAPHSGAVVSVASIYRRDLRGGGRP
ncbi:MAG: NlpC/P60 family protein [Acidimicrobiia bacterium]